MAYEKQNILFKKEQETLLIPLCSKAIESRQPNPIFFDQKSLDMLDRIKYDFPRLKVPRKTSLMVCMRAAKIDDYARSFLSQHPEGIVLHLGCGLDSRFSRVDNGQVIWFDLDMPDVIELRRKFYDESNRYHMIASSVTDFSWADILPLHAQPALVIAEGLLMYLKEEDVKTLFQKLHQKIPGSSIVFDAFSTMTVKGVKYQPSIKSTGALVHWGIDNPREIEQWTEGIRFVEEWFFSQSETIAKLGLAYRLTFKLAGFFKAANKAHRILYFKL